MPSQSSGPLTAMFMFVPLVAVPALAIFGVPEFKQVQSLIENADSRPSLGKAGDAEQLIEQSTDDLVSPVRNDLTRLDGKVETTAHEPADAHRDGIRKLHSGRSRASSNQGMSDTEVADDENWSPPSHVLTDWDPSPDHGKHASESADAASNDPAKSDLDPDKSVADAATQITDDSPFKPLEDLTGDDELSESRAESKPADQPKRKRHKDSADDRSKAAEAKDSINPFAEQERAQARQAAPAGTETAKSDDESLTWKSAVKRLQALGIKNYQLQPGDKANEFHFSCSYAMPNQPRVTRRFEAEAPEPLQAVREVIAQVESLSGK